VHGTVGSPRVNSYFATPHEIDPTVLVGIRNRAGTDERVGNSSAVLYFPRRVVDHRQSYAGLFETEDGRLRGRKFGGAKEGRRCR